MQQTLRVKADWSFSQEERQSVEEYLTEQPKFVESIAHASNIALVKKYFDKIEQLLS